MNVTVWELHSIIRLFLRQYLQLGSPRARTSWTAQYMQAAPPSEMIIRDAIMERGHSGTGLYIGEIVV